MNPTKRRLARVKKEMDEPRMTESTREEAINQTTRQKLEAASSNVLKGPGPSSRRGTLPREENNGKADQASS
jgi:hypothetical protein